MKCPICGAWSEVKETRPSLHETTRRARRCANGHAFPTYEVYPPTVRASKRDLMATAKKVRANAVRWARDAKIRASKAPVKFLAIKYNLTDMRIRQIQSAPALTPKTKIVQAKIRPSTQKGTAQ